MVGFRGSDHPFGAGTQHAGFISCHLADRFGFQETFGHQLAHYGRHPMVTRPAGVHRRELRGLARMVRAAPEERAKAREQVLTRAQTRVRRLSPAQWQEKLVHLRGVAVFLLHGHGDPLVPIEEADRLAERLRRHTIVAVLKSHMVGHTTVKDVSIAERIAHVVQMDDFFDMIGR